VVKGRRGPGAAASRKNRPASEGRRGGGKAKSSSCKQLVGSRGKTTACGGKRFGKNVPAGGGKTKSREADAGGGDLSQRAVEQGRGSLFQ